MGSFASADAEVQGSLAHFKWLSLQCRVEGVLERVGRVSQFTRYTTFATLTVSAETDPAPEPVGRAYRQHSFADGNL